MRAAACAGAAHLGVALDAPANDAADGDAVIGEKAVVVAAREDLEIAHGVRAVLDA